VSYDDVMASLEAMGTAQNRKVYGRHGASEPIFGVSYANLGKLEKKHRGDTALAKQLWASHNHDARILAAKIVDASMAPAKLFDTWVEGADNHVLVGAVASAAARSPHALTRMRKWMKSRSEWVAATGWCLLSQIGADDDRLTTAELADYLKTIEAAIHGAKNRVRHNMNAALISVGVRNATLTKKAIAAAKRIGPVEVDHGETSCKTPAAIPYIEKTVAHRAAMAARRAAKTKAPARKRA
jgi:3-methyladenine DNA glycosylase AlkD